METTVINFNEMKLIHLVWLDGKRDEEGVERTIPFHIACCIEAVKRSIKDQNDESVMCIVYSDIPAWMMVDFPDIYNYANMCLESGTTQGKVNAADAIKICSVMRYGGLAVSVDMFPVNFPWWLWDSPVSFWYTHARFNTGVWLPATSLLFMKHKGVEAETIVEQFLGDCSEKIIDSMAECSVLTKRALYRLSGRVLNNTGVLPPSVIHGVNPANLLKRLYLEDDMDVESGCDFISAMIDNAGNAGCFQHLCAENYDGLREVAYLNPNLK